MHLGGHGRLNQQAYQDERIGRDLEEISDYRNQIRILACLAAQTISLGKPLPAWWNID